MHGILCLQKARDMSVIEGNEDSIDWKTRLEKAGRYPSRGISGCFLTGSKWAGEEGAKDVQLIGSGFQAAPFCNQALQF